MSTHRTTGPLSSVAPYWKAVVGFITPGAVVIGSAVLEGSDGGATITTAEWVTAIVACVITAGGVWAVPNRDPSGEHQDESTQPPEGAVAVVRWGHDPDGDVVGRPDEDDDPVVGHVRGY